MTEESRGAREGASRVRRLTFTVKASLAVGALVGVSTVGACSDLVVTSNPAPIEVDMGQDMSGGDMGGGDMAGQDMGGDM